ncbi:MAG: RNA polymerase sigma factor [Saprospiraceae bacterium]|nr:RNA polymerase sigma factor [Saprospiraceae bacterium]MBK8372382.1 RNA polymerase sigma factor [Saprospiraceae bacterium]MBK8852547.1 RNA polymerase sigma factor [Saprospiraceae bacterium]
MDIILDINGSEHYLIEACIRKEAWAQKYVYEHFYAPMMNVCLRFAHNENEALDILHDGFIKIFRHIEKYQTGTSLVSWMRRIMVNTCIDHYRKDLRRKTENIETAYSVCDVQEDALEKMNAEEILSCLQQLTVSYRSVFNLYVIDGYSHKEIGEILGITESTSRSNLVKARTKLKELLAIKNRIHEQK